MRIPRDAGAKSRSLSVREDKRPWWMSVAEKKEAAESTVGRCKLSEFDDEIGRRRVLLS